MDTKYQVTRVEQLKRGLLSSTSGGQETLKEFEARVASLDIPSCDVKHTNLLVSILESARNDPLALDKGLAFAKYYHDSLTEDDFRATALTLLRRIRQQDGVSLLNPSVIDVVMWASGQLVAAFVRKGPVFNSQCPCSGVVVKACSQGCLEIVQQVLDGLCSLKGAGSNGQNPPGISRIDVLRYMNAALKHDHLEIARYLLQAHFTPQCTDPVTPLTADEIAVYLNSIFEGPTPLSVLDWVLNTCPGKESLNEYPQALLTELLKSADPTVFTKAVSEVAIPAAKIDIKASTMTAFIAGHVATTEAFVAHYRVRHSALQLCGTEFIENVFSTWHVDMAEWLRINGWLQGVPIHDIHLDMFAPCNPNRPVPFLKWMYKHFGDPSHESAVKVATNAALTDLHEVVEFFVDQYGVTPLDVYKHKLTLPSCLIPRPFIIKFCGLDVVDITWKALLVEHYVRRGELANLQEILPQCFPDKDMTNTNMILRYEKVVLLAISRGHLHVLQFLVEEKNFYGYCKELLTRVDKLKHYILSDVREYLLAVQEFPPSKSAYKIR